MAYYLINSSTASDYNSKPEAFDEMVAADFMYCIKGNNVCKMGAYSSPISFTSYAAENTALYIYADSKIKKIVNGAVDSEYDVGEIPVSSFVRMTDLSVLSSGK